jgi:hypothetical protein
LTDASARLRRLEQLVGETSDADDALRAVTERLARESCDWAGILFAEAGELVLGPSAGTPHPDARVHVPVDYQGTRVAELVADGCADRPFLESVAALISPYCLVGWDTGGVPWDPAA